MEVDYKQKYLKYKEKYLKLKAQLGGDYGRLYCSIKECKCIEYKGDYIESGEIQDKSPDGTIIKVSKPLLGVCINCNHPYQHHRTINSETQKQNNITIYDLKIFVNNEITRIDVEMPKGTVDEKELYNSYKSNLQVLHTLLNGKITPNTLNTIKEKYDITKPDYILIDKYLSTEKRDKIKAARDLKKLLESYNDNLTPQDKGIISNQIRENRQKLYPQTGGEIKDVICVSVDNLYI
jgi:D-ribose pyranose/furanose isomerase RbsD